MFSKEIFAERVKALRLARKLTQTDISLILGVSKAGINEIEHARNATSLERAVALADYFGVSLDYLCGRESYVGDTQDNQRG